MKKLLLALFFTIIIVSPVNAQSTLAQQEKCAGGAKKFFFERINNYGGKWGSFRDANGLGRNSFTSHYNKKLDKCFIRIEYTYSPKDTKEKCITGTEVFDVFGGEQYGYWDGSIGWGLVGNKESKECRSTKEFENLIKPYME